MTNKKRTIIFPVLGVVMGGWMILGTVSIGPFVQAHEIDDPSHTHNEEIETGMRQYKANKEQTTALTISNQKEKTRQMLGKIKDSRKQELASKIQTNLNAINTRRTNHFSEQLDKLFRLLEKVATKLLNDPNVTEELRQKMTAATSAISQAQGAVDAQSANDYTITISDESELKDTFKTEIARLRTDIKTTHETVMKARQAVQEVIIAYRAMLQISQ